MSGDALSHVLRTVRLSGAVFFLVDATSPWVIEVPDGRTLAPVVLPSVQHVISYHVITEGACWGELRDGSAVRLEAGIRPGDLALIERSRRDARDSARA